MDFFKKIIVGFAIIFSANTLFAKQIVIWEQMEPNALKEFKEIVKNFENENKDIKVTLKHYGTEDLRTNFQTASLAGSGPDIVYGPDDMVGVFAVSKLLAPVDTFVSKDFLARFEARALASASYNKVFYGLPDMHGNHIALVYNKKLVANAPVDWNTFLNEAKKNQKVDKDPKLSTYGLVFHIKEPYWFIGFYNGFGGQVFDANGAPTLDNKAMVDALTFVRDIKASYGLGADGMDYNVAHQLFSQGKAAFILQGAWAWNDYQKNGLDVGVTNMHLPNGKKARFYSSTKGYYISNSAKTLEKKADIAKFFDYVFMDSVHKKYSLAQGTIPTITTVKKDKDVQANFLIKNGEGILLNSVPMPNVPEMRAVWDAIRPNLEMVIEGKVDPKVASKKIQEDAVKLTKTILGK